MTGGIFIQPVSPGTVAAGDNTVVLGSVFYLSSTQTVLGVQYYRADGTWDGTSITVALYDPSGALLSTAARTQQPTDPVGMVSVLFSAPLALSALGSGNQYTIAMVTGGTNLGHYAFTNGFFATDWVNGPYTVPAGGGRFRYVIGGVLAIPDHGTTASYFVDVVPSSGSGTVLLAHSGSAIRSWAVGSPIQLDEGNVL